MQKTIIKNSLTDDELAELIDTTTNSHYVKFLERDAYGWIVVLVRYKSREESKPKGLFD